MIKFTVNGLPKMPNQLLRKHWAVISQEAKKWHILVHYHTLKQKPAKPHQKVKAEMTRFSTQEPDRDGLSGSFKYVMDGLVKAGIMVDDKPSVVVECIYKWEKSKLADQRIEVKIEPVN